MMAVWSFVLLGLLLVSCAQAEDGLYGGRRRDLLQICPSEYGRDFGNKAIGGIYTHPEIRGVKVDYCHGLSSGCGKRAADAFCQLRGMEFAETYVVWNRAGLSCGRTRTVGTGEICTGECRGFRMISCAGSALPPVISRIFGSGPAPPLETSGPDPVPAPVVVIQPASILEETEPQVAPESIEPAQGEVNGLPGSTATEPAAGTSEDVTSGTNQDSKKSVEPLDRQESTPEFFNQLTLRPSQDSADGRSGSNGESSSQTEERQQEENKENTNGNVDAAGDGVQIDHPGLGDVVLPGQDTPITDNVPSVSKAEIHRSPSAGQGGEESSQQVSCQERGSQSAVAAARSGCASVIAGCASNEAFAHLQSSATGRTGRRLAQNGGGTEECKKLFADECQAAAFDHADGLCAILMGNGPNAGEEKPSCNSAEQAREIFKTNVQGACGSFRDGAFP